MRSQRLLQGWHNVRGIFNNFIRNLVPRAISLTKKGRRHKLNCCEVYILIIYTWNNSYLNCGCGWKWRMIIAVIFQFKQLERRSLKKSGLQRHWNPWRPPRYRCNGLPTELWSHTLGARPIYWVHGRFPFDQYSGLKFRVFHATNGTVISRFVRLTISRPSSSKFRAKNTRSNGGLFYLCLLALGLLNDSEVKIKRCIRWGWQYTFYSKNLKGVRDYIYGTFLFSWWVQESLSIDERAVHSIHSVMLIFHLAHMCFGTTH